jgi:hypothetical protein
MELKHIGQQWIRPSTIHDRSTRLHDRDAETSIETHAISKYVEDVQMRHMQTLSADGYDMAYLRSKFYVTRLYRTDIGEKFSKRRL